MHSPTPTIAELNGSPKPKCRQSVTYPKVNT